MFTYFLGLPLFPNLFHFLYHDLYLLHDHRHELHDHLRNNVVCHFRYYNFSEGTESMSKTLIACVAGGQYAGRRRVERPPAAFGSVFAIPPTFCILESANGQTLNRFNTLTQLSCIIVSVNSCCNLYIYTLRSQYSKIDFLNKINSYVICRGLEEAFPI